MKLPFTKMHGAGNDFVVLDATRAPLALSPAQYRFLADRRFGIGADQILIVEPGDPAVRGKLLFLGLWFLLVSTLSTLPLILGASGVAAFLRARPKAMRWIDYVFAGVMGAFAVRLVTARL